LPVDQIDARYICWGAATPVMGVDGAGHRLHATAGRISTPSSIEVTSGF